MVEWERGSKNNAGKTEPQSQVCAWCQIPVGDIVPFLKISRNEHFVDYFYIKKYSDQQFINTSTSWKILNSTKINIMNIVKFSFFSLLLPMVTLLRAYS